MPGESLLDEIELSTVIGRCPRTIRRMVMRREPCRFPHCTESGKWRLKLVLPERLAEGLSNEIELPVYICEAHMNAAVLDGLPDDLWDNLKTIFEQKKFSIPKRESIKLAFNEAK